jgi:hypothetical protein
LRVFDIPVGEQGAKLCQDGGFLCFFKDDGLGRVHGQRGKIASVFTFAVVICGQVAAGGVQRVMFMQDGVFLVVGFNFGFELGERVSGDEQESVAADGDPPVAGVGGWPRTGSGRYGW